MQNIPNNPTVPAIDLQHTSASYGQVQGLNDITCQLPLGQLTALLGPNGAGKSTLLRLVTGQMQPTTGRVLVLGAEPFANPHVLKNLGYCPEFDNFYEDMTGRAFVTLLASMNGYTGATLTTRVNNAIERVGMTDRCDKKLGGYSKGMRQRIKIAQAIVHDPDVLILDEPLNGLDPIGRRDVVTLLQEYAKEGKCVLISSHILYEVEQITDRILVIFKGRLLAQGDIQSIRAEIDKYPHKIQFQTTESRKMTADLMQIPSVVGVRFNPKREHWVEVETYEPNMFYDALSELILDKKYTLQSFHSPDNSLETVFRYLITS
jgi:ABC-2 type transport system ATP-binding protein